LDFIDFIYFTWLTKNNFSMIIVSNKLHKPIFLKVLRHMEWFEAADLIVKGVEGAIANKTVTYDFERLMDGAKLLKC